jgi:hypothetical protein
MKTKHSVAWRCSNDDLFCIQQMADTGWDGRRDITSLQQRLCTSCCILTISAYLNHLMQCGNDLNNILYEYFH